MIQIVIHIEPVRDGVPHLHSEALMSLTVKENGMAVVTQEMLRFIDSDSADSELVYTITSLPR